MPSTAHLAQHARFHTDPAAKGGRYSCGSFPQRMINDDVEAPPFYVLNHSPGYAPLALEKN
jgi:hypothetical protein